MFKERLISGLIGCMFIIIFQPFSLMSFGYYRWVLTMGISLCILGSIFSVECLLTWVFRMPHDPSRGMVYLVRRNLVFQVLNIIGMTVSTVFFVDRYCCMEGVDNHLSWATLLYTFLIYLGCSLVIGLYWRNVFMKRDYHRQLEEAQYLNGILQERGRIDDQKHLAAADTATETSTTVESDSDNEAMLTLSGSTKESLALLPRDFIYAEAKGNYVNIHYLRDGQVNDILLRCGISQIEEVASVNQNILRCHRAFVVNLKHVSKLENRGSSLQLFFKEAHAFVPVSKTYMPIIKERIVDPAPII